jgi:hypothetical protein
VLPRCNSLGAKFSVIGSGQMSAVKKDEIGDLAMN